MNNSIHQLLYSGTKIEIFILNLVIRTVLHSAKFPVPILIFHCNQLFLQNQTASRKVHLHILSYHQLIKKTQFLQPLFGKETQEKQFSISHAHPHYLLLLPATYISAYMVNHSHKNPTEENSPSSKIKDRGDNRQGEWKIQGIFQTPELTIWPCTQQNVENENKNSNTEKYMVQEICLYVTLGTVSQNCASVILISINMHRTVTWEKHEKRPSSENYSFKSIHEFENK